MELSKKGWLHKIAYGWYLDENKIPERTNLCRFFWRVLLSSLFVWPFVVIVGLVAFLFYFSIATPIGLSMGYKPTLLSSETAGLFTPASWRSVTKRVWQIFGVALLIGAFSWLVWSFSLNAFRFFSRPTKGRTTTLFIFAVIALVVAWHVWRRSEFFQLLKARVKAKKDKVCPIIEFK